MERPITFKAPDILAILDGRKTQERRVITREPAHSCHYEVNGAKTAALHLATEAYRNQQFDRCFVPVRPDSASHLLLCPFGGQGDTLWVRETWMLSHCYEDTYTGGCEAERYDGKVSREKPSWGYCLDYRATDHDPTTEKWRPSIHMPRWASRITLEITDLNVERLHSISAVDAEKQGHLCPLLHPPDRCNCVCSAFEKTWQKDHGLDSWNANPYVWVIDFKANIRK